MKKVFIIPGFQASPNSSWFPWLMGELKKLDVWACTLAMPSPAHPLQHEWVAEIARQVESSQEGDEVYLVGHSLGASAILRYLELTSESLSGVVLISGRLTKSAQNQAMDNFFAQPFNFKAIKSRAGKARVIHGADDPFVPLESSKIIARELGGQLVVVPGGGHFMGRDGWRTFPQCLDALREIMK